MCEGLGGVCQRVWLVCLHVCQFAFRESMCECVCQCAALCLSTPLSPGEEPVLEALLQSRPLEARLAALYPDRGKPTVRRRS